MVGANQIVPRAALAFHALSAFLPLFFSRWHVVAASDSVIWEKRRRKKQNMCEK